VFIAEILERKPTEVIERKAMKKLISIADLNQDHLRDRQKTSVNALMKTASKMLDEQDQSEPNFGSFLGMYATASADHTFNWFNKQHWHFKVYELDLSLHSIQSSTLDPIWTS
jgi:hypothetical protein